jgi:hypothetical protein
MVVPSPRSRHRPRGIDVDRVHIRALRRALRPTVKALESLQGAVHKLESGKTFDPNVGNDTKDRVDDRDKVSRFFQVQAKIPTIDDENIDREIEPNSDDLNELGNWLGGRDSNPDNVVQRAVNELRPMSVRSGLFGSSG